MRGVLNTNKPEGLSSYDVIRSLKKIMEVKRIGYVGTLDPLASGVLLVLLEEATKVAQFLEVLPKEYIGKGELGILTDTLDSEGKIRKRCPIPDLTSQQVKEILKRFKGEISQTPPSFSALSRGGVKLYKLARVGVRIKPKPRLVKIDKIELLEFNPPFFTIKALVSKGTYIRSLIRDIGEALGSCANLVALRRTKVGKFRIEESIDLSSIDKKKIPSLIIPIDRALYHLPLLVLKNSEKALTGKRLLRGDVEDGWEEGIVKLRDRENRILVIGKGERDFLKPLRVIYADNFCRIEPFTPLDMELSNRARSTQKDNL